ncbi:MAG: bifunctional [glutamate--ammonia ligase]-adenylyl-L-tyrosine phosphorylase/[glutamate--ammonia-ligase] adenylyltransferase, partial [Pseudomonadales bacterium]|nr:bifunctional [glutamate--ammonia ligase]-adenylyl-L-tyrosine phosphorylase/[glutamate--ammonia-ligase] adenylyltransferase [Pseudomonadales bacterium]
MFNYATLYQEAAEQLDSKLPDLEGELRDDLLTVCSLSDYFLEKLRQDPAAISDLIESGDLERSYDDETMASRLSVVTENNLDADLRRVRHREVQRILFRDLTRRASLEETTRDLSNLADACIGAALDHHYRNHCQRYGVPVGVSSGRVQQMAVIALGKLGAWELNLSSDVDLVFIYDEPGAVENESLTNQEFFVRTARKVIATLDEVHMDGFVFRVDMRLRPYGESGALILHRSAMEKYYVEQGRDWERYAFIKARTVAGDREVGEDFLRWMTPFVYRRHLDYGAIESLREMKRLINREVVRNELQDDLKLGPGGIREVEFIVQANQLIWGGTEPHLQDRRLLYVLPLLGREGFMPREDVERLEQAYRFLRNSEHVLQAEKDRQTQELPESEPGRTRLAIGMGFDDFEHYENALNEHRNTVIDVFSRFMGSNNAEREILVEGNMFWVSICNDPETSDSLGLLESAGFKEPETVAKTLSEFTNELQDREVQEIARERIGRMLPLMLSLTANQNDPDETFRRLLPILHAITRRTTYVAFLLENMDAFKRMVDLCAMSPWVAERLEQHPILLYELSDRTTHEAVFEREKLVEELEEMMSGIARLDLEEQMDTLRQFKHAAVLKVAIFELLDLLPLMKASDALTDIAEIVLDKAVQLAWEYLADRHGEPLHQGERSDHRRLAVVSYGKLGGIELGYGSDLDLVFIHDADTDGQTDGEKSIHNNVFYSRLAQRIVHILTRYTRFGVLYEVDLRLRPSGNKGPMANSLTAWEKYLMENAWTWEHQALVRARFVAGDRTLRSRFEEIRAGVL